jgi:hypothetical protein
MLRKLLVTPIAVPLMRALPLTAICPPVESTKVLYWVENPEWKCPGPEWITLSPLAQARYEWELENRQRIARAAGIDITP